MTRDLILPPPARTRSDAFWLASHIHRGQIDKAKQPYIWHVMNVHARLVGRPITLSAPEQNAAEQVAYLHDVLEPDERPYGRVTADDLRAEGFAEDVVTAASALTRTHDETYAQYIARLAGSGNRLVILVKIADLEDNLDPARLARLEPEKATSLRRRYGRALGVMRMAAKEVGL